MVATLFDIFENLSLYLISPDAWMVMYVFNREPAWPLWLCYVVPIVHSVLWVAVKTSAFRAAALFFQWRAAKRQHTPVGAVQRVPTLLRRPWRVVKVGAAAAYQWGRRVAHSKPVTARALFWFGLEPQLQKAGCALLGILWPRFGFPGFWALCLGGSVQVLCFATLYSVFGKTFANVAMYCIFVPLGLLALYRWLRRNGANDK